MSERLPVRQTDIPADGSFDSKDKCFITAGSTCTTCPPLRCKSVDSVQPLVLLKRTKAELNYHFKDKAVL